MHHTQKKEIGLHQDKLVFLLETSALYHASTISVTRTTVSSFSMLHMSTFHYYSGQCNELSTLAMNNTMLNI